MSRKKVWQDLQINKAGVFLQALDAAARSDRLVNHEGSSESGKTVRRRRRLLSWPLPAWLVVLALTVLYLAVGLFAE